MPLEVLKVFLALIGEGAKTLQDYNGKKETRTGQSLPAAEYRYPARHGLFVRHLNRIPIAVRFCSDAQQRGLPAASLGAQSVLVGSADAFAGSAGVPPAMSA
jgi:hypothetical protein